MEQILKTDQIALHIEYMQSVNYAMLLNGGKVITDFYIKNISGHRLEDLNISISGFYFPEVDVKTGSIEADDMLRVSTDNVIPDLTRLQQQNEGVYTEIKISIRDSDNIIGDFRFPITIQAWNNWVGNEMRYQELASFVMPNHPYVAQIIEKATSILQQHSRYTSFYGYNIADNREVIEQIRAIWTALLSENLKYLTINPNYIDEGQRVMTPEMIARYKHGNCLDLSLLLCSCLERIGLSPCLVSVPGHIVAGVWMFPDYPITDSVSIIDSEIRNCTTDENPILMLIESTAICYESSLDDAIRSFASTLNRNKITFAVDVINARKEGIRPLPINSDIMSAYQDEDIKGCLKKDNEFSRKEGWERKLLDLTLRNVMLDLKPGKTIVPIRESNVTTVVEYIKMNRLSELVGPPEKDNLEQLKSLYRAARTSIEENGANTLFVSLGTLRWFDVDDSRPHIAPLLFIPVSIVRKKAMTYEVRLRDDEAMINVTLIEMLRQMFGVSFPEFEQLPEDEEGFPNWRKIFDVFSEHIKEINKRQPTERQWELPIKSYIGIFSFTKFLMWHDVHFHPEVIEHNPVLRGLMENHYNPQPNDSEITNAQSIESESLLDLMMPVDFDSSQLEAVAESHYGSSFVLHGPPGTGKSQTITNMIADALYSGKRILFVAEKKAALDVVRSRLNAIGLEPYCLELHSNKTDKRSFFNQVQKSGIHNLGNHSVSTGKTNGYQITAQTLKSAQNHLSDITKAIHSKNLNGMSLYHCVNQLLSSGYYNLMMDYRDVEHLSPLQIDEICAEFRSLDLIAEILGYHPGKSDLVGIYPRENTATNQAAVSKALAEMPEAIEKARKKAVSFFNRWFKKRSPEEILRQSETWQQLSREAVIDSEKFKDIDVLAASIEKWNKAIGGLRKWYHFSEKASKISEYRFSKAFDFYLLGNSGGKTADAVKSSYYRANAYHTIDNDRNLRGFSGRLHQDKIERYRQYTEEFQKLRRDELIRKMEENISRANLSPRQESQLSVLLRRLQTRGRGVALRKVIADSGDILTKLFPCMLMSPLSVAQYLDMKSDLFDIVIFDEASQMETSDAVGTIARGRSLVVVGDPLQLPPTRFFTTQTSTGEDIEESEDSDSILEDCIAIGMKSHYLSRHYRSHHESLIAFSNSQFYDNRLLTFPSHNDSQRKVSLIDPNGIYDYGKTRTNRIEAEAVVKHVIDLLEESTACPSIGIVAFSKAQSNLIEDILNAKLQRNKALQKKLDEAEEALFVKNLENVQGDERDIIIFSIGYGPDKNGNVSLNFGPLNQSGGERRLNVAVSRAREEMIIFSSLLPQHIPAEGVAAKGVSSLRQFLTYAIDGKNQQMQSEENEREVIIDNIAEKLREKGLQVATKVGRSDFKIDIAIVDKENPDNYSLGLILDGRDYNALPTVRDREITVPSVLQSLGWRLHRLWTIDWLENPESVIQSITDAIP
ncbi:MAG: DUF4011 domain-containing protein [Muribaculaceae bacterium]|nr:DUF4011 domain-containing protein [Muribaculaceae bacterium]